MTYLYEEQIDLLLHPIHPRRVLKRDGMSYVEGYDIRAELDRVFGFARWAEEILDQERICETAVKTKGGKDAWYVVYRTRKRLIVNAPDGTYLTHYDASHVGESTHPVRGEAHGNAITNSETYALRRCAINLGDQFGLSLYNKGSLEPIVRWTLVHSGETVAADTDDVLQISAEEGNSPAEEPAASAPSRTPRKAEPKLATPQQFADAIALITGIEQLRATYLAVSNAGFLMTEVVTPTGEKMGLKSWMERRSDELVTPKSPGPPPEGPGSGGDQ